MSKRKHAIETFYQRAIQLHASGQGAEAERMYREILAAIPAHADSIHMLGVLALQAAQPDAALRYMDQAIALRPRVAGYYVNRANALHRLGRLAEAEAACGEALRVERSCAEAYQVLGHTKSDQRQAEEAVAAYQEAARLKPGLHDIHNNLGIALRYAGRLEEAERSLREAVRREPGEPSLVANLSGVLKELGRVAEAETCLRDALRSRPDDPALQYNLGLLQLLTGNFTDGWTGYEARARAGAVVSPPFRQPRWTGEALAGRVLLVYAEQGLGSVIQFSRYVPLLAQRVGGAGRVIFQAPRSLMRLLSSLNDAPPMIAAGAALPPFDLVCPLLSLPHAFATTVETVPRAVPYLAAEADRVALWRARLAARPTASPTVAGFKVGIAWQGNPTSQAELGRSIPLAHFLNLARVPAVRLISLQKHDGLDQLAQLPADTPIETLDDSFDAGPDAFLDAAAVMQSLDLVITTDTSIAHLAGALGRPVWVALQHVPDWRWMLPRPGSDPGRAEACPWYPSMRLYRQLRRGDWSEVFTRIATDLTALAAAGAAPVETPS
jgi:tetratricopeptide (TPR) repeat protein